MFSRRWVGGSSDSFRVVLEFGRGGWPGDEAHQQGPQQQHPGQQHSQQQPQVRLPVPTATVDVSFDADEPVAAVADRFVQRTSQHLVGDLVLKVRQAASG
jgi:hypothetical protein